ncbi:MAG: hypothetical protein ACRECF_00700 [Methyloceanibacter sp.]
MTDRAILHEAEPMRPYPWGDDRRLTREEIEGSRTDYPNLAEAGEAVEFTAEQDADPEFLNKLCRTLIARANARLPLGSRFEIRKKHSGLQLVNFAREKQDIVPGMAWYWCWRMDAKKPWEHVVLDAGEYREELGYFLCARQTVPHPVASRTAT